MIILNFHLLYIKAKEKEYLKVGNSSLIKVCAVVSHWLPYVPKYSHSFRQWENPHIGCKVLNGIIYSVFWVILGKWSTHHPFFYT